MEFLTARARSCDAKDYIASVVELGNPDLSSRSVVISTNLIAVI